MPVRAAPPKDLEDDRQAVYVDNIHCRLPIYELIWVNRAWIARVHMHW